MTTKPEKIKSVPGEYSTSHSTNLKRTLGICMGAATIGAVELMKTENSGTTEVAWNKTISHDGNPKGALKELLRSLDLSSYDGMAVTGRRFKDYLRLTRITEPRAVERALQHVNKESAQYNAMVTLGAESFLVYELAANRIVNVHTGNKCASGTGNFFLQQIDRMDLDPEEAVSLAAATDKIHAVSGRCSVFCKSDCTHALNKGVPKGEVTAGLCKMIANKITELLANVDAERVVLVGGVTRNKVVMDHVRDSVGDIFIPEESTYFEALGAALWASENETICITDPSDIVIHGKSSFDFLEPLKKYESLVDFKSFKQDTAVASDVCCVGLDVGSTTTKAIILRMKDNAVLASTYLRTNGDPIGAARNCYAALLSQINCNIKVVGLGTTGSGRQIAGLHALTDGIINEIIAHAKASVYFNPEVDTIFEIGGQDAKYTYLTNSVPSDYAMNEACSAGTGSFLEESAKETLGIDVTAMADIAMQSVRPPNFNDQCAAFINSDIKNAISEGIEKADIVAGLVYSVCMNYNNRVRGSRPTGNHILMQGGVCYNKAVPVAMAALTGKQITVPPEPGLMGAFGVALAIKERLELGLMEEKAFDLQELVDRGVTYGKTFTCRAEKDCDIACEINMINVMNKKYAFGGACNRYYNKRLHIEPGAEANDHVKTRQQLVFEQYAQIDPLENDGRSTVGINRSFLMHSYYPLFYNFFNKLGFRVILSDESLESGMDKVAAPFCFPLHQAHGHFQDLLNKKPDHIFLPQIKEIFQRNSISCREHYNAACYTVQGETYVLQAAFPEAKDRIIDPVLNFGGGWDTQQQQMVEVAKQLGKSSDEAQAAYAHGVERQLACTRAIKDMGKQALENLKNDPERIAIVLFGRPYNAFNPEGNLNVPRKMISRGYEIIPFDALPFEEEYCEETMHWAMGQMITKARAIVKRHPQLFGVFITNFSCGPDSFLLRYFREEMGKKPSLTLELDEHTADVGADTRIDAFLDIVTSYRELEKKQQIKEDVIDFKVPKCILGSEDFVIDMPDGNQVSMTDKRVKMIVPNMGLISDAAVGVFNNWGVKTERVEVPDFETLRQGRANTTCKECLPLIITAGSLLEYIETSRSKDEILVYFMPAASGGCRLGQYSVFLQRMIQRKQIPNATVLSLDPDLGWSGFPREVQMGLLKAFTASDCCYNILNALKAIAVDRESAVDSFWREWEKICLTFYEDKQKSFYKQLSKSAAIWSKIPLKRSIENARKVAICGEIFVRTCHFSKLDLIDRLADEEIIGLIAPTMEWFSFVNWRARTQIEQKGLSNKVINLIKDKYVAKAQDKINRTLAKSNLYEYNPLDMEKIVGYGQHLVRWQLGGDPVLTCGASMMEITHGIDGTINIGPFACMQARTGEAIMSKLFTYDMKKRLEPNNKDLERFSEFSHFPFLAIESDGNLFPPIINARLEAFALQVERMNAVRTGTESDMEWSKGS